MNTETRKNCLLGLYAETSIHAGTGQNTGVVDLPIQREAHTHWPCIYGSSLKGAMRADAAQKSSHEESIKHIYGPDPEGNPSDHAGALSVGDARLLLLPVRSLSSSFCWVTSPEVLRRLQRDASRAGVSMAFDIPEIPDDDTALWTNNNEGSLFLEEYRFNAQPQDFAPLIDILSRLMAREDATDALAQRLVMVSDSMFSHLCQYATPVAAHVRLDQNKTVASGALWYEETLPPDTLMFSLLSSTASRRHAAGEAGIDAASLMEVVLDQLREPGYLQVGGNETVGMGWFRTKELR